MVCFSIHSQVTVQPKNNAAQELLSFFYFREKFCVSHASASRLRDGYGSFSLSRNKKKSSKTIQCIKLRNWDVI